MYQTELKILRLPEVISIVGMSRSSIYKKISCGLFPQPVSLGSRAMGFLNSEIGEYLTAIVQGESRESQAEIIQNQLSRRNEMDVAL